MANYILNTDGTTITVNLPQIDRAAWGLVDKGWNPDTKQMEAVYNLNATDPNFPSQYIVSQAVEKSMLRRTSLYISTRAVEKDITDAIVLADHLTDVRLTWRTPGPNGFFDPIRLQTLLANLFSATFVTAPSGVMDTAVLTDLSNGILRL